MDLRFLMEADTLVDIEGPNQAVWIGSVESLVVNLQNHLFSSVSFSKLASEL